MRLLILAGVTLALGAAAAALGLQYVTQRKVSDAVQLVIASRTGAFTPADFRESGRSFRNRGARNDDFGPAGASVARSGASICYDRDGRPMPSDEGKAEDCSVRPSNKFVATPAALVEAIRTARAGDVIQLMPGTYRFSGVAIYAVAAGRADAPIVVRAAQFGDATLEMETGEGFAVQAPWWVFENLDMRGVCKSDNDCNHAFHLSRDARSTILRNNRIVDFNSQVKINAAPDQSTVPDDVLLEHNSIYDTHPRDTGYPVTKVDSVRASGLTLIGNAIADFAKQGADQRSYAAFAKGGGSRSRFERNLVICEWMHKGGERIGLSFGGGGTADRYCVGGKCEVEDRGGLMRSNIIADCADAGIYLRRAAGAWLDRNLIIGTKGIDARFGTTEATLSGNILDGRVMAWKGAQLTEDGNVLNRWRAAALRPVTKAMFAGPGRGDFAANGGWAAAPVAPGARDFCGAAFTAGAAAGPFGATCAPQIPAMR